MNLKRSLLVICLIALFACIFMYSGIDTKVTQKSDDNIISGAHADYMSYNSIKELSDVSTVIIKGEVIAVHAPKIIKLADLPDGKKWKEVFTVSDIRVSETIKGNIKPGEIIQVKQRGGLYDGEMYNSDHPELFAEKMQGIFFLATYDGYPASCINPTQGFLKIVNGVIEVPKFKQTSITADADIPVEPKVTANSITAGDEQKSTADSGAFDIIPEFSDGADANELVDLIKDVN